MKRMVTGGAGFIGSNYIYYLLEKYPEDQVICLDALTYAGNIHTLQEALKNRNFSFIQGDITNSDFVMELFDKNNFDQVINFAAESHVDRSIEDPSIFIRTNILGTQVLLEACRKFKIPRFHQVSTDEVYGDLPLDRPDLLFTEETPLHTSSPYSASKASADLLVQACHRTYGLPVTISRCSNNYGPYQFPEKLIPLMITRALADQPLPVYGKGENVRDWLYVKDHCSAIDRILCDGEVGEVYNIGGRTEKTNMEIVRTILRELGKPEELIQFVPDRLGHDLRYAIDPSKIQQNLGWQAEADFEEGIRSTIQWYVEHADWWNKILTGEYRHPERISSTGVTDWNYPGQQGLRFQFQGSKSGETVRRYPEDRVVSHSAR